MSSISRISLVTLFFFISSSSFAKVVKGSDYLNICNEKNDPSTFRNKKEKCETALNLGYFDTEAVKFCEDNRESDTLFSISNCYLNIRNRHFQKRT